MAWLAACAGGASAPRPVADGAAAHTLYVVSNGWHTGIVLARAEVPPGRIAEAADFPQASYLEFGWGDRDYYPAPRATIGMALSAAFASKAAVIHLAGHNGPPQQRRAGVEVVALPVTRAGFDRLTAELDAAFDRAGQAQAEAVAPGLYPDSRFYPAHGRFSLFNTCNTWIAGKLEAAGVSVSTSVVTADDLMRQLRPAQPQGEP